MQAFCVNRSLNCCAIKLLRQLLVHSSRDLSPSLILVLLFSLSLCHSVICLLLSLSLSLLRRALSFFVCAFHLTSESCGQFCQAVSPVKCISIRPFFWPCQRHSVSVSGPVALWGSHKLSTTATATPPTTTTYNNNQLKNTT